MFFKVGVYMVHYWFREVVLNDQGIPFLVSSFPKSMFRVDTSLSDDSCAFLAFFFFFLDEVDFFLFDPFLCGLPEKNVSPCD